MPKKRRGGQFDENYRHVAAISKVKVSDDSTNCVRRILMDVWVVIVVLVGVFFGLMPSVYPWPSHSLPLT